MSSSNPLKQASAFDKSLDDLGTESKAFSSSGAGKAEAAADARDAKKAENEAAKLERQAAKEAKIAEAAEKKERTVVVTLSKEALTEAVKAAVCKLTGVGADAVEEVLGSFPRCQTRLLLSTKEAADALKEAVGDEDGYTLKGKEATGGLQISSVKRLPISSRMINFVNPIEMPNRRVPNGPFIKRPAKPAEGEEVDEAAVAAYEAEKLAAKEAHDAAQEQVTTLYNMFKEDVVAKVNELFSAPGGGEDDDSVAEIESITLDAKNIFTIQFASRATVLKAKAGFFNPMALDKKRIGSINEGAARVAAPKRAAPKSSSSSSNGGRSNNNNNSNRNNNTNNGRNNNGKRGRSDNMSGRNNNNNNNNNNRNNNNRNNNNNNSNNNRNNNRNNNNNNNNNNRNNNGSNKRRRN